MSRRTFDEIGFLKDLRNALAEAVVPDGFDEAQVMLVDRWPDVKDLITVEPPSILILPDSDWMQEQWGSVMRCMYRPQIVVIAQTLDATNLIDNWDDSEEGGAVLRAKVGDRLFALGDKEDGRFRLSGPGTINYVLDGSNTIPFRIADTGGEFEEAGRDFSAPSVQPEYDIEW